MAIKRVRRSDLRVATASSVKALLGKRRIAKPGILVGLWIDRARLRALDRSAMAGARGIAADVSMRSGIKLTPVVRPGGKGVLVGYLPPKFKVR